MSGLIGVLISIIIALVLIGVVWWAVQQLLPLIPLGEPFGTIVRVLMTVVLVLIVLWVLIVLLGVAGVRVPSPFSGILAGRAFAALSTGTPIDL